MTNGYIDLPPGKLANVVTCLEMCERPALRAQAANSSWRLRRVHDPSVQWYRALFRRIGERYLWFSRLLADEEDLRRIITDPLVEVYTLDAGGLEAGLLELDFRTARECELSFFGLVHEMLGTGAGPWLMNRAIERAWSQPIHRFWLHTCSLDHPSALAFYRRSGFTPFKRQIEICDDPRAIGLIAPTAAPEIPIL